MIFEPQTVSCEWFTPNPLEVIERAGRTCYKSESKITLDSSEKFVKMLLDSKHESVIEHASASFRIVTDRGVTHELVRHRLSSFSQESTRYCNYSKDKFHNQISVVMPVDLTGATYDVWYEACENAERAYFAMLESGAKPQLARAVLPNSLKTEIVVTANMREWRHIMKLRTSKAAHPQMRDVALKLLVKLTTIAPVLFEDIQESI